MSKKSKKARADKPSAIESIKAAKAKRGDMKVVRETPGPEITEPFLPEGETKPPEGETPAPTPPAEEPVTPESPGERMAREATEAVTTGEVSVRKKDVIRRYKDTLPVRLSEHEMAAAAGRAGVSWDVVLAAKATLATESATLRAAVKAAEVEHGKVMQAINQGTEMREVDCIDVLDWEKKIVFTERLDLDEGHDGRIVTRRNMTEEERQFPLPIEGGDAPVIDTPDPLASAQILSSISKRVAPEWHKEGDICKSTVGRCRKRHITNPDVLTKAGIKYERPPMAEPEPDQAERAQLGEGLAAEHVPDVETPGEVEQVLNEKPKPDGWMADSPDAMYRGKHVDDGTRCFRTDCEREHEHAKEPAPMATPTTDDVLAVDSAEGGVLENVDDVVDDGEYFPNDEPVDDDEQPLEGGEDR
jgi:hypothetical protein